MPAPLEASDGGFARGCPGDPEGARVGGGEERSAESRIDFSF